MKKTELTIPEKIAIEKGIMEEGDTLENVYKRVARTIAQVETAETRDEWTKAFSDIMTKGYFLPNFPCLRNGSREDGLVTSNLSACFVLDIEDSRDALS